MLSYRQNKPSRFIFFNPETQPVDGKLSVYYDMGKDIENREPRLSGELWIDTQTFNVRREVRTLSIHPALKIAETVFEYQDSDFGILTPRKIVHTQYRIDKAAAIKEAVITFEYAGFTKPDVEVKSSEIRH